MLVAILVQLATILFSEIKKIKEHLIAYRKWKAGNTSTIKLSCYFLLPEQSIPSSLDLWDISVASGKIWTYSRLSTYDKIWGNSDLKRLDTCGNGVFNTTRPTPALTGNLFMLNDKIFWNVYALIISKLMITCDLGSFQD